MASYGDDQALLQGIRKGGLTGPPPGFVANQQQPPQQQQQPLEFDDRHLSSIFRLALEEDMTEGGSIPPQTTYQHIHHVPVFTQDFRPPADFIANQQQQQGFNNNGPAPVPQQQQQRFMQQPPPGSPGAFGPPRPPPQMFQCEPQQQHFMGFNAQAPPPQQQQFGFPPPPMQYGMPPRPAMPLPFPPQQRPLQEQQQNQLRFKDYERMKGREIAVIVRNQLKSVETGDDFSDDFYFIQNEEKKRLKHQQQNQPHHHHHPHGLEEFSNEERPAELLKTLKAIRDRGNESSNAPMIRAPMGPLPELKGQRTAQMEAMERKSKQSTKAATKWAGANNVLGRTTKANLRTPRELLALAESLVSGDSAGAEKKESYSSGGWKLRKITSEVSDALGEVQDITRHLKARAAALPPGPPQPGWEFVHEKVRMLEQEQHAACERLADVMGLTTPDGDAKLLSLLWLPRGRRVACKAARSLLPEHLLLFLEAAARMLVYFTCTSPDGKNSSIAAEREKFDLDMLAAGVLAREFSSVELDEATKLLRLFLESQTPESLRAVIATPGGAEVSKSLLIHGQELCESSTNADMKNKWNDAFGAFIAMAEEGISAKENGN